MTPEHPIQNIVHLVAPPSQTRDGSGGRIVPALLCAESINSGHTPDGRRVLIGDDSTESSATALGLRFDARISPVFHNPRYMARNLQTLIGRDSRVICWNDELFASAAAVCPKSQLISTSPNLATNAPRGHSMITVVNETDRETWRDWNRNAVLDRDLAKLINQFNPSFSRDELRDQLGLSRDTLCIGALSDSPQKFDARQFTFMIGLFSTLGYSLACVVPGNADKLDAARRHHRMLTSPFRMILADSPIVSLLPALDLLFHTSYNETGSSEMIERVCENHDTPVIRISHSQRQGLTHTPGEADRIVQQLDKIHQTLSSYAGTR